MSVTAMTFSRITFFQAWWIYCIFSKLGMGQIDARLQAKQGEMQEDLFGLAIVFPY